jgi:hypothetical protein
MSVSPLNDASLRNTKKTSFFKLKLSQAFDCIDLKITQVLAKISDKKHVSDVVSSFVATCGPIHLNQATKTKERL